MWTKSIVPPLLLITSFLVIFQISYGKPTTEEPFNHSTTTEPVDIDVKEDGDVNSSFLESVSVLLTVISPNDSATAEEDSTSPLNNTANSTTTEPEYYDDHNLTTSSSTLNELEAVEDADDSSMLSGVHLGSSTESSSSLLSSLITDEMEVADSLDESVTATVLTLKGDGSDFSGAADDDRSRTADVTISSGGGTSIGNRSRKDSPPATDDSIIIASMSSNLNVDTVEPPSNSAISSTDVLTKEEITSSSHLPYDDTSGSSVSDPTANSVTDVGIQE